MKTLITLILVFSQNQFSHAQDSESGLKKYALGNYGVELSLGPPWNYNMISINHHEFLYDCRGTQKCANIQVKITELKPDVVLSDVIDYVMQEFKKANPEITLSKSELTINGISYSILDSRTGQRDFFTGQTLALAKTKYELLSIVYTGVPERSNQWAKNYAMERSRFFKILNSLQIKNTEPEVIVESKGPALTLIRCNDSTSYLIERRGDFRCQVKLTGKVIETTDKQYIELNNNILVALIDPKNFFLPEGHQHDTDSAAMHSYINSRAFVQSQFSKKYYFETFTIALPNDKDATVWRLNDNNYVENQFSKMVFISMDIGDYYFTIEIIQRKDQKLSQMKELLTKLIKSLKYGGEAQLDSTHLCTWRTGGY